MFLEIQVLSPEKRRQKFIFFFCIYILGLGVLPALLQYQVASKELRI